MRNLRIEDLTIGMIIELSDYNKKKFGRDAMKIVNITDKRITAYGVLENGTIEKYTPTSHKSTLDFLNKIKI